MNTVLTPKDLPACNFRPPQHFIIYLNFSFTATNKRRSVIKTKENYNKRMLVVYKFFYGTKERMFFKKSFLLYKDTSYILKILSTGPAKWFLMRGARLLVS